MRTWPSRPTADRRGQIARSITLSGVLLGIVRQRFDELLEDGELLVVVRLGGDRRGIQDRRPPEAGRGAADRERARVGGPAHDLGLASGALDEDASAADAAATLVYAM